MKHNESSRSVGMQQTRYQKLLEYAKAGARISNISSHDPQADVTRAAIEFADLNELGGDGHWLAELQGTSMDEQFNFLANAFASSRITEATSYFDDMVNQWKFHIGFWYVSGATSIRHECTAHFETDVKRAIAHANERTELKSAATGSGNKPPEPQPTPTLKTRTDTI